MSAKVIFESFLLAVMICGCGANLNKKVDKDNIQLLQGSWRDSTGVIYYIRQDTVFRFRHGSFYRSTYQFKNDTFFLFALTDFDNHAIIESISRDFLKLRAIETNKQFIYTRPDSLEIQKDNTVVVESDSLVETTTQKINGFDYSFEVYKTNYDTCYYLEIRLKDCEDSCLKLTEDLIFVGGDCNMNSDIKCVYEIHENKLMFYYRNESVEHFDDTNPHPETIYRKETYQVDGRGSFEKFKTQRPKKNSALAREIDSKIEKLFKKYYL